MGNPIGWGVIGNIAPIEVSEPQTVDVFTANNCALSLESVVVVDGNLLIPVKATAAW